MSRVDRRASRLIALVLAACSMGASADDWPTYGRTLSGTHYSPAAQIDGQSVGRLQVAWTYRTGDMHGHAYSRTNMPAFEATPLKVGDTLYLCTPHNILIAIDATTGAERWRHDTHANVREAHHLACRGVSYYASPQPLPHCQQRILAGTMDGRLVAVDAQDGVSCADFGTSGSVDLTEHLGPVPPDVYGVTSAPTVVGGVVLVGAMVNDNQARSVPAGVVRAFDPQSGRQLWAYDAGRDDTNPVLGPGETYTRGSPNAWSLYSADERLGMVYLPSGSASPDYYGAFRTAAEERNSTSIVALDLKTGRQRWVFQTVHHDLWDFDVPSQPALVDIKTPQGIVPGLIQATKRGELFVLDRRDGQPISRVEERPVPQGAAPGDRVSATQPFSVDMPFLGGSPLSEESMWGISPLDLIWCRAKFRSLRYEGIFTPPSEQGSLHYPSNTGATNWGGVSIDEERHILVANTMHIPSIVRLVRREQVDALVKSGVRVSPMTGTPYGVIQQPFLSPLGIPCNAPPWGRLTAIDLDTRTILWQAPFGTTRNIAPFSLELAVGTPNIGGSLVTKGGLVFIGAALDNYLRAFDIRTGRELWKASLPAGAQATPMTYVSERDGRQYIVIAAGGHSALGATLGDYVIAYALPARSR